MQDQMIPNSQTGTAPAEATDGGSGSDAGSVTIAKTPDGGFTVNGHACGDIDQALAKAREMLVGDDGGMSVEEAFRGGFRGDDGMAPARGMGGGY